MVVAAAGLILLLLFLTAAVRLFERRFAFFPAPGETVTPRDYGVDYQPIVAVTRDGERLHGWWLVPSTPRAAILYFHGNGAHLSLWAPVLARIARRRYVVCAFDYRGYGLSTGRPSEPGLYRDVDAMLEWFWHDIAPDLPVVYWGRSLGATMAAYAVTHRPPCGLILESGFPNARALVRTTPWLACLAWFSSYRFPTADFLRRRTILTPTLVMHGDDDHVVPIEMGRLLFERIAGPKEFVTIRGGDHNDLTPSTPDLYWEAVDRFVTNLPKPIG